MRQFLSCQWSLSEQHPELVRFEKKAWRWGEDIYGAGLFGTPNAGLYETVRVQPIHPPLFDYSDGVIKPTRPNANPNHSNAVRPQSTLPHPHPSPPLSAHIHDMYKLYKVGKSTGAQYLPVPNSQKLCWNIHARLWSPPPPPPPPPPPLVVLQTVTSNMSMDSESCIWNQLHIYYPV